MSMWGDCLADEILYLLESYSKVSNKAKIKALLVNLDLLNDTVFDTAKEAEMEKKG